MKEFWIVKIVLITMICSKAYSSTEELMDHLRYPEWIGGSKFVEKIKSINENECTYLKKLHEELNIMPATIRVLDAYVYTNCKNRLQFVSKLMSDKNPLVRAASIRLAQHLPLKEKKKVAKQVETIYRQDKDKLVKKAAKKFLAHQ